MSLHSIDSFELSWWVYSSALGIVVVRSTIAAFKGNSRISPLWRWRALAVSSVKQRQVLSGEGSGMSWLPLVCCGAAVQFSNYCRGRGFPYGTVGDVPQFFLESLGSTFHYGVGWVEVVFHPSSYHRSAGMLKKWSCRSTWIFSLVDGPLRLSGVLKKHSEDKPSAFVRKSTIGCSCASVYDCWKMVGASDSWVLWTVSTNPQTTGFGSRCTDWSKSCLSWLVGPLGVVSSWPFFAWDRSCPCEVSVADPS